MRIPRLVAGAVTVGLVGLVPLAISSPASAVPGSITLTTSTPLVVYKDTLSFSGSITGPTGSSVSTGTANLEVSTAAVPTFTPIATDTSPGFVSFFDVPALANAQYRVTYSGGTAGFGSSAVVVDPGSSAPVTVAVQRKVKATTKGLSVIAKVTPDYGREKVKILTKQGKKYKNFRTFKTNKAGKFTFRAPRRDNFKFVIEIPGDATFAPVYNPYKVTIFG